MTVGSDERRCAQVELIALYLLRALSSRELLDVEAHLAVCADCRQERKTLQPAVENLAYWPTDVLRPSISLWERLANRVWGVAGIEPPPSAAPGEPQPEWLYPAPGISYKLLSVDTEQAGITMLVKLAAGTSYPSHTHAGVEELYLLHGELWIDGRKFYPGDYRRAEPLTSDKRVWTESGCTCVLITSAQDSLF